MEIIKLKLKKGVRGGMGSSIGQYSEEEATVLLLNIRDDSLGHTTFDIMTPDGKIHQCSPSCFDGKETFELLAKALKGGE